MKNSRTSKVKSMKAWAIVSPQNRIVNFEKRRGEAIAWAEMIDSPPCTYWKVLRKQGYRCIRVLITPIE